MKGLTEKLIKPLAIVALTCAAGLSTAATVTSYEVPQLAEYQQDARFVHMANPPRHLTARLDDSHISRVIERQLEYKADKAVAAMYEAPTFEVPVNIELEL